MNDLALSPRVLIACVLIALACIAGLARMGNPEPALPRCNPDGTYQMRCRP